MIFFYEFSYDLPVVKIQVFWFWHAFGPDAALRFTPNHPDSAFRTLIEVLARKQGLVNAVCFSFIVLSLGRLVS
jgi:hypothetical protein